MKYRLNQYERHAYLYSAWASLLLPCLLTCYVLYHNHLNIVTGLYSFFQPLSIFVPIIALYAAIGFYIRELFRCMSKIVFQHPLFKENETEMPTTELLLWKNRKISKEQNKNIRDKMFKKYNFKMLSEAQELKDEKQARLNIVDAVSKMRIAVKDEMLIKQCNYRYGFQRNQLGGLLCSFVLVLLFLCMNYLLHLGFDGVIWISIGVIIIQSFVAYFSMRYAARNYARYLINSFAALG